jgi:hypothetical protein
MVRLLRIDTYTLRDDSMAVNYSPETHFCDVEGFVLYCTM